MSIDSKSWAEKFVAKLTVDGERVPFERVLALHLEEVTQLRATSGLTWRSMASLLARAGVRRADGGLISADQLRVSYARLTRRGERALEHANPQGELVRQAERALEHSNPQGELMRGEEEALEHANPQGELTRRGEKTPEYGNSQGGD